MKKLSLLLASVGAGLLLVGGTLATALVSDNADPFGVKVTPGTIGTDSTEVVTLDWGAQGKEIRQGSSAVANIENIGNGETVGPYYVNVKATAPSSGSYTGVFKITLTDNSGKTSEQVRLIDHVKVYASLVEKTGEDIPTYSNAKGLTVYAPYVESTVTHLDTQMNVTANHNGTEVPVYLYVALEEVSVQVYDQISVDNISLTVDWAPQSGDMTVNPIYFDFNSVTSWSNVYAYAYYAEGTEPNVTIKKNAPWPGEKLTLTDGLYPYNLGSAYTTIIFNNGLEGDNLKQTANISLNALNLKQTPKFRLTSVISEGDDAGKYAGEWVSYETASKQYFITGIINGVTGWGEKANDHKLTVLTSTTSYLEYHLDGITLKVGDEIKVIDSDGNYYPSGDNWVVTQGVVGEGTTATFNIYFAPHGDGPTSDEWADNTLAVVKQS